MRRVACALSSFVLPLIGCDCGISHSRDVEPPSADAAPERMDAPPCSSGEPCDCRAVSLLPAGVHWVGVDYARDYVGPAHRVTLTRDSWIGTYEGSAGCYDLCIREGACTPPADLAAIPDFAWWGTLPTEYWTRPEHADLPIVWLSPEQAEGYCSYLGGRLPTSAELEKLARGDDGRAAPWMPPPADPRLPEAMNWESAAGRAHPAYSATFVRSLLPIDALPEGRSPYGHFNVIGNALEWAQDDFRPYPGDGHANLYPPGDTTDPLESGSGNRIIRSTFGDGWVIWDEEHLDTDSMPPGVRCAFDARPEMLAR